MQTMAAPLTTSGMFWHRRIVTRRRSQRGVRQCVSTRPTLSRNGIMLERYGSYLRIEKKRPLSINAQSAFLRMIIVFTWSSTSCLLRWAQLSVALNYSKVLRLLCSLNQAPFNLWRVLISMPAVFLTPPLYSRRRLSHQAKEKTPHSDSIAKHISASLANIAKQATTQKPRLSLQLLLSSHATSVLDVRRCSRRRSTTLRPRENTRLRDNVMKPSPGGAAR